MGLFDWIKPGNDRELAADIAQQQRVRRSRSATRADRKGQRWNDRQQAREPKTNWSRNR